MTAYRPGPIPGGGRGDLQTGQSPRRPRAGTRRQRQSAPAAQRRRCGQQHREQGKAADAHPGGGLHEGQAQPAGKFPYAAQRVPGEAGQDEFPRQIAQFPRAGQHGHARQPAGTSLARAAGAAMKTASTVASSGTAIGTAHQKSAACTRMASVIQYSPTRWWAMPNTRARRAAPRQPAAPSISASRPGMAISSRGNSVKGGSASAATMPRAAAASRARQPDRADRYLRIGVLQEKAGWAEPAPPDPPPLFSLQRRGG